MRHFILIIFVLTCLQTVGQFKIEGKVLDELTGKPLVGTGIYLQKLDSINFDQNRFDSLWLAAFNYDLRYDTVYKKYKSTKTDLNGLFLFDSLSKDIYRIEVFHRTKEIEAGKFEGEFSFQNSIITDSDKQLTVVLHVTCEFDSTKHLVNCPKCKKSDQVKPIKYGMIPYDQKGLDPKYYYNGYCVIERCQASKRCMRCEYEF